MDCPLSIAVIGKVTITAAKWNLKFLLRFGRRSVEGFLVVVALEENSSIIIGKVTKYGSEKVFIRASPNYFKMFYSFFNPSFESLVNLTIRLLDNLNVKVNSSTVNKTLKDHPEYPSLLSVSDALNQWNVHNIAIQVDQSRIYELPVPFIAHIKTSLGTHFELVTKLSEENLEYFDYANRKKTVALKSFSKKWSGIALLATATPDSGELNYEINLKKEVRPTLVPLVYLSTGLLITLLSVGVLFISPIAAHNLEINWAVLTVLKFVGVIMTTLLLSFDLSQENSFLYKVCGNESKPNCHAVLKSKVAQIVPGLRWSEVGFFYFFGSWILTIITTPTYYTSAISFLFILNLATLPYILYSVYYQSIIIKQWCKVCLIVLALLILEFASFSIEGFSNHYAYLKQIDITFLPVLIFAFTLPIIIWYVFKYYIIQLKVKAEEVQLLKKIKFNSGVFLNLLKSQARMPDIQEDIGIILQSKKRNNSNSNIHILVVLSLYCSACAQAQFYIEELIEKTENLKVQIVFIGTENLDDQTLLIMSHILNIAEEFGGHKAFQALGDLYNSKEIDYDTFIHEHPLYRKETLKSEFTMDMKRWYDKANIKFTPTYYVNGYMLPDEYSIEDLKYFFN